MRKKGIDNKSIGFNFSPQKIKRKKMFVVRSINPGRVREVKL